MKIYIKFFTYLFLKSFFYVLSVMFSLVFILNLLTELEFFKSIVVSIYFPLFLSFLNSPNMIFEMFPFIFFISTQLFFIKLFNNNEIDTLKYSGLKNTKILIFLSIISFISGLVAILIFYNFSSNLKNIYMDLKSPHTKDGKYLAVITKNGLWIKDVIENRILIVNSSKIEKNYLIDNFITEFDNNFNLLRNISSKKIDISDKKWLLINAQVYEKDKKIINKSLEINTHFNYETIQTLYSNLSSLSIFELYDLRQNYKNLGYSITDINLHILKLISFPLYFLLMTLFSSLLMYRMKYQYNTVIKISFGLFLTVIIYYINNFFTALGGTEKIPLTLSVFFPLLLLAIINSVMLEKINEK
jgi:lipopolysaccharide export system permease protein